MGQDNPFSRQPATAFWRTGVAEPGLYRYENLWQTGFSLPANVQFATYGSCFAQHISRALVSRGLGWVNAEPSPSNFPADLERRFNYGIYSARTANIYTARALECWVALARDPALCDGIELWNEAGRTRDSLRPMIEPDGFDDEDECRLMLRGTAHAFRRSVEDADVFVFTMGLTEGFENAETGQPYAMCPGTLAGNYDEARHVFRNYTYPQIMTAMQTAIAGLRAINPGLRIILTVSPVPLTATASGDHVLAATTYSKSVLRAVAGDLAAQDDAIAYFPSYELIATAPTRGQFYEPNMRSVSPYGVQLVMEHFFAGLDLSAPQIKRAPSRLKARQAAIRAEQKAEDLACEEQALEAQNAN
ncbi:GSCFA domain-containing protein [Marimonas lutisalis]|uniref:GSCFA domain-containing protein n=1 Tax=Marimonas lutisalis TaxID=2545756 RepID=UPI0010F81A35|nr:GSCFA domain-containing protein [Marimonas lutisalis]